MTDTDYPWEPPLAGSEAEQLFGALDRLRTTFRVKADGLDTAALRARIGASSLTIGGLLQHVAAVEDHTSAVKLSGEPTGAPEMPWAPTTATNGNSPLRRRTRRTCSMRSGMARCSGPGRASTRRWPNGGLDGPAHASWPDGQHASVRRLVCDLIEEYGRHTGHADLLRESIDGVTGEDPPPGWRPVTGRLPRRG